MIFLEDAQRAQAQSPESFKRLFLPHKSDMGFVFTRLNKQLSTVKSTERKLFKKRQPDEEIEQAKLDSSSSLEKKMAEDLLKHEVCDWQNFMQKDQETIRQINSQDELQQELASKTKTQETTKRSRIWQDGNERYVFFQRMRQGNKLLPNLSSQDFLSSVRHSSKLNEYAKVYKQQPQNIYLSLNLSQPKRVPKTFGLIQNTSQLQAVNTNRCLRSREDCRAFSCAMLTQQSKTITSLQMNHNIFDPQQLRDVLLTFPNALKDLELIDCKLHYQHMDILMSFINKNQIAKINLEKNNIRDQGCKIIMKYLMNNNTLQHLNLNNNQITECSSMAISNLLKQTQRLLELYLGYNNLNSSAGNVIWKAMYKNTSVKILDLSHNNIASLDCAVSIAKAIARPYNELLHVDLSYNKFTYPQAQLIAESLIKNETIYGFHFEGNQSELVVNPNGFLVNNIQFKKALSDKLIQLYKQPQYFKLLEIPKQQSYQPPKQYEELVMPFSRQRKIRSTKSNFQKVNQLSKQDTCWICEGWQEIRFEWNAYKSGSLYNEPIFIHFDFEEYRPFLMTHLNNEFFFVKMCPPNQEIHYFFTNPILGVQQPAMDQQIKYLDTPIPSIPFLYNDEILVDGNALDQVNILQTYNKQQLFDKYMPLVQCKPREPQAKFDFSPYLNIKKHNWSVDTSIFRNFQPDTPQLIDQCFEFDFQNSKVTRLVKETEIVEVKESLKDLYRNLFHVYKYHAAGSQGQPIPCILIYDYIDFLVQTSLMEGMKTNDIDISFTSTSAAKDVSFPQAYEKGLVRCQLLEIMIRLCNDKYIRPGLFTSMVDSISAIKQQCQEYFSRFDQAQQWRKTRLWNQKCDILLNDRIAMLKSLYKYCCKLSKKPQQFKFEYVSIQDFKDMVNQCKLICDDLNERECCLVYLQSMITQKDELFSSKHYQMNFHEFIEACSRLAEKLSIIRGDKHMDIDDRRPKDLHTKLDGFLLYVYLNIGNEMKSTLPPNDPDIKGVDKCMINDFKSLKQKLEDSFTDGDEPPYDPRVELPHLSSQITNVLGNTIGGKKQTLRSQMKQIKKEEQKFSLINFVQYFKSIQQLNKDQDD
ncbi:unnamed protein product [Paramecium pentaurelia]|uniref:Leucine Rich Repeat family protein n=1 Tax=Paramecium pentaurelia TaxID=43138 RepID=A0A8S1UMF4_9CILI|nr:unnamed protein product [Paramecium pentaurelia]